MSGAVWFKRLQSRTGGEARRTASAKGDWETSDDKNSAYWSAVFELRLGRAHGVRGEGSSLRPRGGRIAQPRGHGHPSVWQDPRDAPWRFRAVRIEGNRNLAQPV